MERKYLDVSYPDKKTYNPLYGLIQQAGALLCNMRVCESFVHEQRRSLWLYYVLEPETWKTLCYQMQGAHSGGNCANESGGFYALQKNTKISTSYLV